MNSHPLGTCRILVAILVAAILPSCNGLKLSDSAPALQPVNKFVAPAGTDTLALQRIGQLNLYAETYNKLIIEANRLFSKLDGRRRGTSKAALYSQGAVAAGGIATAALTAAAPQANVAWIQGLNAFGTGTTSVRSEFATQRMTAEAYTQTLTVMANDIIEARRKIDFIKAYGAVFESSPTAWSQAITNLGSGLTELESAIVLRPLTLTVSVLRDNTSSKTLKTTAQNSQ